VQKWHRAVVLCATANGLLVYKWQGATVKWCLCRQWRISYSAGSRIAWEHSQDRHEDASGDSGARRPDGREEVDSERRQTDVVVEEIVRVSRPQQVEVRRAAALNQRRHCVVTQTPITHGCRSSTLINSSWSTKVSSEIVRVLLYRSGLVDNCHVTSGVA